MLNIFEKWRVIFRFCIDKTHVSNRKLKIPHEVWLKWDIFWSRETLGQNNPWNQKWLHTRHKLWIEICEIRQFLKGN